MLEERTTSARRPASRHIVALVLVVMALVASLPGLALAKDEHHADGWTEWTDATKLPETAGKYFLGNDVELEATWAVPSGETTLCLNGKDVTLKSGVKGSLVKVSSGSKLTLDNCEESGALKGGTGTEGKGGSVFVEAGGTFNLAGGAIKDAKAEEYGEETKVSQGGGVYVAGSFTMTAGEIAGNTATLGADVYVDKTGTIQVEGKVKIANLALCEGRAITVSGEFKKGAEGEEGASIGVAKLDAEGKTTAGVVTDQYSAKNPGVEPSTFFKSVDTSLDVFWNDESTEVLLAKKVSISFDANGGKNTMAPITGAEGSKVTLTACGFERDDYTFTGWNTKADGKGDTYTDKQADVELKEMTLYAQWKENPKTFTVSYNKNADDAKGTMENQTATEGQKLTLNPNAFTRDGYTFKEWNTKANGKGTGYADGGKYTFSANTTLYAQWEKIPVTTFTISYNKNADDATGTMESQTATEGVELTLNANAFTRDGYTFKEWNTKANGKGTSYADGGTYAFSEDVVLYAQWTKNPDPTTLTVTFDKNADDATGTMEPQQATKGEAFALRKNVFVRSGYTFDSWNTKADGSGTKVPDGARVKLNANVTLYAQWLKSGGGVEAVVDVKDGAPQVSSSNLTEVANAIFTINEKNEGAKLTLTVSPSSQDALSDADKQALATFISRYRLTTGAVFDISLNKQVAGGEATAITSTTQKVALSVQVPGSIQSSSTTTKRTFYLLRIHDGEVVALSGTTSNVISAQSDKFSPYVIAYRDGTSTNTGGNTTNNGSNGSNSSSRYSSGSTTTRGTTAKTGDSSITGVAIAAIALVGVAGIAFGIVSKRKH